MDTGTSLDDLCSNDGGQAAAQTIVADEDVVGAIGTSCSGAAVAAAPLITDAGMVLISGGNTSPALTSDLAGTAGPNYSVGYYRTAHNDLYQGAAMAKFVFSELGISEAAAIHDGDPYTQGLAQAFADAFEAEGGTVTGFSAVNKDDTDMEQVFELFPRVKERLNQKSGTLSGGEQQMVAIGRALMADPRVLLMDEPSMGLAPALVQQNFELVQQIHEAGLTVFMVEQNANMALSIADRGWVLQTGRVVLDDTAENLLAHPDLQASYLGTAEQ